MNRELLGRAIAGSQGISVFRSRTGGIFLRLLGTYMSIPLYMPNPP